MITKQAKHKLIPIFYMLSVGLSFSQSWAKTNPTMQPIDKPHVQEAPPPWAARPDAIAQPTEPQASSQNDSSMEKWYRNRRAQAAKPNTAIGVIQTAAQQGDADAQYELGTIYQSGAGVARNPAQAEQWLSKAANQGHAKAQYALAMLYRGNDSEEALQRSLEWQQKAAQSGYAEAQYGLGVLYANGQYVEQDPTQAQLWFQKAASQGHVAAKLALLSQGADVPAVAADAPEPVAIAETQAPEVVVNPEPAAVENTPSPLAEALNTPAKVTQTNTSANATTDKVDLTGIEADVVRQSADEGDKQAQLLLGTLYEDGLGGLNKDLSQAAYWYEKSAKQGFAKAQYNLGLLYEDGRGVQQDYKRAAYWYAEAAKENFSEALNNLGVLYIVGNGVPKDAKKAAKLFTQAANQGNTDAKRNLQMLKQS
jgi:hypothetical protein